MNLVFFTICLANVWALPQPLTLLIDGHTLIMSAPTQTVEFNVAETTQTAKAFNFNVPRILPKQIDIVQTAEAPVANSSTTNGYCTSKFINFCSA